MGESDVLAIPGAWSSRDISPIRDSKEEPR
jgi:hypothetical protein